MQADSVVSGTNGLLTSDFWLQFFDMRRETQFLKVFSNQLCWLHPHMQRILWCLRSLLVEIKKKKQLHLRSMAQTQLSTSIVQSQLSTDKFSKSSNSQDHLFWAWHQPHSNPFSCLGSVNCTNWLYTWALFGGTHGVMVIVAGNGHSVTSSNPGQHWLYFT